MRQGPKYRKLKEAVVLTVINQIVKLQPLNTQVTQSKSDTPGPAPPKLQIIW